MLPVYVLISQSPKTRFVYQTSRIPLAHQPFLILSDKGVLTRMSLVPQHLTTVPLDILVYSRVEGHMFQCCKIVCIFTSLYIHSRLFFRVFLYCFISNSIFNIFILSCVWSHFILYLITHRFVLYIFFSL